MLGPEHPMTHERLKNMINAAEPDRNSRRLTEAEVAAMLRLISGSNPIPGFGILPNVQSTGLPAKVPFFSELCNWQRREAIPVQFATRLRRHVRTMQEVGISKTWLDFIRPNRASEIGSHEWVLIDGHAMHL